MRNIIIGLVSSAVLVTAEVPVEMVEKTGEGFYLGAGAGMSGYTVSYFESEFNFNDDTYTLVNADNLDDNDVGYLFYAGYQINKIIGVEASYTDYGKFQVDGIDRYYQEPKAVALYANAGYTFLNGQLRPFGMLGLGYLQQNQSDRYISGLKEDFVTFHMGAGVDYYPTILRGLGFRAAFTGDLYVDSAYTVNEDTNITTSESLWEDYSLIYVGIQYKF